MADSKDPKDTKPEDKAGKAKDTAKKPAAPGEEPVRVNNTKRNVIIAVVAVIVVVAIIIVVAAVNSSKSSNEKGSASNPIRIGVIGATGDQWPVTKQKAEEQGIYIDIIDFQDYKAVDDALAGGDLDLNQTQHILYLANYNKNNGTDLVPIGGTAVYPLGLYSKKVDSVDDIKEGDTVAIPNDQTNQARAIGVLKSAGLVELKNDWTAFSTPEDIDTDKSKVKVTAIEGNKIAHNLDDPQITAGVINNDYVTDAGLEPTDALYQDSADTEEAHPYINVWAARKEDANNELYLKVAAISADPDVEAALQKNSGGTASFADKYTPQELQDILYDLQDQIDLNE